MLEPIDILLVDDHPLLAAGLKAGLAQQGVTLELAPDLHEASVLALIEETAPRLVTLDYSIPTLGVSTRLIKPIRALGVPVVVLTGTLDDAVWGSLIEEGALGVIGKDEPLDQILDALCRILTGASFRVSQAAELRSIWQAQQRTESARLAPFEHLSPREAAVLAALAIGHGPADIAAESYVSVGTVRSQLKSVFRKLGVSSQLEAVAFANDAGWVGPSIERSNDSVG